MHAGKEYAPRCQEKLPKANTMPKKPDLRTHVAETSTMTKSNSGKPTKMSTSTHMDNLQRHVAGISQMWPATIGDAAPAANGGGRVVILLTM